MEALLQDVAPLTEVQFERVAALVKDLCGINLNTGKKELVKARLGKRVRESGHRTFDAYLDFVQKDASRNELTYLLDAISTNLTFFFRESAHFDHLRDVVLPGLVQRARAGQPLRLWSAGCSSGEEPYSLAITLVEAVANLDLLDVGILATDLSTRVLAVAKKGVYDEIRFKDMPPVLMQRHFERLTNKHPHQYQVAPRVRRLVHFARLNLMQDWPMRGPFDVIFCRNVMIYFDKPTQGRLINRFYDILRPKGILFIGHSESLSGIQHKFRYQCPTVYEKA